MNIVITLVLALLAFVAGTVLVGFLGDQGPGLDLAPFLAGTLAASAVLFARLGLSTKDDR